MSRAIGGMIIKGAANIVVPGAEEAVTGGAPGASLTGLVRNALGDNSWNNGLGVATFHYQAQIDFMKRPFITFPSPIGAGTELVSSEFQQLFGTGAGGPGNPFSGGQSGNQFGQATIPWGLAVIDIFAVYSVTTVGLTTATLALNRATYVENVAFTNAALVAPTGVALTTSASATSPHVQKVTLAQPLIFESADFSDLTIEFLTVTAATTALRVYVLGMHVAYKW